MELLIGSLILLGLLCVVLFCVCAIYLIACMIYLLKEVIENIIE